MNKTSIDGYTKLIDVGNQYSEDISLFYNMMSDCMSQAKQLSNELTVIKSSMSDILKVVEESTGNISCVTGDISDLSEDLSKNKVQSDENLVAMDILESEIGKFRI